MEIFQDRLRSDRKSAGPAWLALAPPGRRLPDAQWDSNRDVSSLPPKSLKKSSGAGVVLGCVLVDSFLQVWLRVMTQQPLLHPATALETCAVASKQTATLLLRFHVSIDLRKLKERFQPWASFPDQPGRRI